MTLPMPYDTQLRDRIAAHVAGMIGRAALETDPFPHVHVRGFFPADVYADLLRLLPPSASYEPFAYEKHRRADGESNRRRFPLTNAWLDKLAVGPRAFWYAVRSALGSAAVKCAIFDKLSPGLSLRYGIEAAECRNRPGFALPELFHETQGYVIKPHPDTRRKVVTMQIALPADDSQRELGTEFYRRSLNPLDWLREPRGFQVAKQMPFLPNTAYAFAVLNTLSLKSWHGRTAIPGGRGERNSLLNIWYEKAGDGNPDLIAEQAIEIGCSVQRPAA